MTLIKLRDGTLIYPQDIGAVRVERGPKFFSMTIALQYVHITQPMIIAYDSLEKLDEDYKAIEQAMEQYMDNF